MDKYVVEKVIGEGTYGVVYKAVEKATGDVVAIKKFKSAADEQLSKREIQACSMLNHPYIVSYRQSFRHEGLLHLVFDFVREGMTKILSRNRRGIKPHQAQKLIYQLCLALQYCHSNQVIHRDVKPDNILIDEHGDIKLCDFGVARVVLYHGDPLSDYVATRWYRPPEQELRMDRYTFNADVWSIGCVLVELLTGRPLFPGNTQLDQLNLIQSVLGPLPPVFSARLPRGVTMAQSITKPLTDILTGIELPDGALDFLTRTLQLDPKIRISATECLSHPFLRPLRDADARRKDRQREEHKQKGSHFCNDDDGIEEDIPGEKPRCPSPVPPKVWDSKASSPTSKEVPSMKIVRGTLEFASPKKKHLHGSNGHHLSDNNTDCDSDDIQELIEGEDTPLSPRNHAHRGVVRRRSASGAKGRRGDPVDRDSCYEDDFED